MAETILADDHQHTTREDIRRAIQQRTTRGMLTFNTGSVHRLEGDLWAVPSTRGGFHRVDLGREECDCEDFQFYGRDHGVACRHVYAAAIANATRRSGIQVKPISPAGDPFTISRARINRRPTIKKGGLSPERRATMRAGLNRLIAQAENGGDL